MQDAQKKLQPSVAFDSSGKPAVSSNLQERLSPAQQAALLRNAAVLSLCGAQPATRGAAAKGVASFARELAEADPASADAMMVAAAAIAQAESVGAAEQCISDWLGKHDGASALQPLLLAAHLACSAQPPQIGKALSLLQSAALPAEMRNAPAVVATRVQLLEQSGGGAERAEKLQAEVGDALQWWQAQPGGDRATQAQAMLLMQLAAMCMQRGDAQGGAEAFGRLQVRSLALCPKSRFDGDHRCSGVCFCRILVPVAWIQAHSRSWRVVLLRRRAAHRRQLSAACRSQRRCLQQTARRRRRTMWRTCAARAPACSLAPLSRALLPCVQPLVHVLWTAATKPGLYSLCSSPDCMTHPLWVQACVRAGGRRGRHGDGGGGGAGSQEAQAQAPLPQGLRSRKPGPAARPGALAAKARACRIQKAAQGQGPAYQQGGAGALARSRCFHFQTPHPLLGPPRTRGPLRCCALDCRAWAKWTLLWTARMSRWTAMLLAPLLRANLQTVMLRRARKASARVAGEATYEGAACIQGSPGCDLRVASCGVLWNAPSFAPDAS